MRDLEVAGLVDGQRWVAPVANLSVHGVGVAADLPLRETPVIEASLMLNGFEIERSLVRCVRRTGTDGASHVGMEFATLYSEIRMEGAPSLFYWSTGRTGSDPDAASAAAGRGARLLVAPRPSALLWMLAQTQLSPSEPTTVVVLAEHLPGSKACRGMVSWCQKHASSILILFHSPRHPIYRSDLEAALHGELEACAGCGRVSGLVLEALWPRFCMLCHDHIGTYFMT